jgi:ABC-2 type transport system permease protein
VWFRSVYLKTLRDFRVPILGWGLGLGLLMAVVIAALPTVLATPAARAAVVALGPAFAWFAEPVKVDTPGGYATWKYGLTVLVVSIWPILAQTATLRGEEERGSLDTLLSVPLARARVAVEKVAAMWTALLVFAVIVGLLAFAGTAKASVDFGLGDTILFGVNIALIAAVFGAVALFVSQFVQERRTAAGITAGVLLICIVLDMVHRVEPGTDWISRLSPVYYYNLSKPLIPSYGTNVGAMLVQLAITVVLSGAAVWLFARRDLGDTIHLPGVTRQPRAMRRPVDALPVGDWTLRSVYARSLGMIAMPTLWWTLAIAGFSAWMVEVVKQTAAQLRSLLEGSSVLKDFIHIGGSDAATNSGILSALFIFAPILLMSFAVTQSNRWSADLEDGRLELVLSTPQPRVTVMLGRFAALATATVVISLLTLAATALASSLTGVALDGGNLLAATLSMIPLALLVAAIGYALSGWLRAAVDTGLVSFVLVIWFVIVFLGPGLKWPDATLRLSALYYYGTPLLNGVQIANILVIVFVGAAALAIAATRFMRKDLAA